MLKASVYALIGDPVEHSLSPAIYNALFRHFGMNAEYILLRVEKGFLSGLDGLIREWKLKGLSVTMPHKEDVMNFLDALTPRASLMRSVNHVYKKNGKWTGDSVDGAGVVNAVKAAGPGVSGKNALVLGYGGAARSAVYYLSDKADSVTVLGRDIRKAETAAAQLKAHAVCELNALPIRLLGEIAPAYDLVVNATPMGMEGYDRFEDLSWLSDMPKNSVICDMVYKPVRTELLAASQKAGLTTVAGADVLIYQAYEQFFNWTGKQVDREADKAVRTAIVCASRRVSGPIQ